MILKNLFDPLALLVQLLVTVSLYRDGLDDLILIRFLSHKAIPLLHMFSKLAQTKCPYPLLRHGAVTIKWIFSHPPRT